MPPEPRPPSLSERTALVVGLGGLGCPAAMALAEAGVGRLILVDDDEVDESNLHRQVLYEAADVGRSKVAAARERLGRHAATRLECIESRFLPDNARALTRQADVVIEGADNYATKFLVADSAHLERRPVVHGAALGWQATAFCTAAEGGPCLRCLFEDVPTEAGLDCSTGGVMGPVVGFGGALLAELALGALSGQAQFGVFYGFSGKTDRLRRICISPRPDCPLCGSFSQIFEIDEQRYSRQICAA